MRLGKTVAGTIREFIAEPETAQMLDHMVQYVGSSPDASPAILTAIGHMQMQEGIWFPMGGTRAVPEAMVKLATELGVEFHTSTDVARIMDHFGQWQEERRDARDRYRNHNRGNSSASTPC